MNARGRSGPGNGRPPLDATRPPAEAVQLSPEARARLRALRSMGLDDNDDFAADAGERDDLTDVPGGVRLQKVLAAAGVGSRRHCEELIGAGRVEVDGQVVRRFGARVDPEHQIIRVDGRRIPARQDVVYLAFNKPRGVLTAMSDDRGRKTIVDFLGMRAERLFHVGRLDYDTEGLMLLTNDGELAHRLAHPSYEVAKTYWAEVPGPVPRDLGRRLQAGVELDDGVAVADKFRVLEQSARPRDGGDHAARGPQAHRAPHARRGRPPGEQAAAHHRRPDPAWRPAPGRHAGPRRERDRRAVRRRGPLAARGRQ